MKKLISIVYRMIISVTINFKRQIDGNYKKYYEENRAKMMLLAHRYVIEYDKLACKTI